MFLIKHLIFRIKKVTIFLQIVLNFTCRLHGRHMQSYWTARLKVAKFVFKIPILTNSNNILTKNVNNSWIPLQPRPSLEQLRFLCVTSHNCLRHISYLSANDSLSYSSWSDGNLWGKYSLQTLKASGHIPVSLYCLTASSGLCALNKRLSNLVTRKS